MGLWFAHVNGGGIQICLICRFIVNNLNVSVFKPQGFIGPDVKSVFLVSLHFFCLVRIFAVWNSLH